MRIGGLASGMDTEGIVRQLMQAERQPLDRFLQRKISLEWQRDAYRDMNLKLKSLEESAFKLRLSSAFNTRQATSSNPSAFTVTTNTNVRNGTYQFEVEQVATRTRNVSNDSISSEDKKVSASTKLNDQTLALGADIGSYNGQTFSISTYNSSGTLVTEEFTINTEESLNDLFKKINDSNIGVRAFYDSTFDKVVFERKNTGEFQDGTADGTGNQISFDGDTDFLTQVLKLNINDGEIKGQDAKVRFTDPVLGEIERTSKTNQISVGNMNFNIMQPTGPETVTVTSNTDQAFDNIKAFVDKYNETIAEIQVKLSEPKHRGFPPLTDEQRRELSEREANLWDEKAMSGMLRRDPILTSVLSEMRTMLYTPVKTTGQFTQIAQIGIKTSSNFRDGGRLEIDEKKLREALEQDPDAVHQLFNNVADKELTDVKKSERTTEQRNEITNQTGLIGRIRSVISDNMDKIVKRAGNENRTNQQFTLGREMMVVDNRIDNFQRKLVQIEQRYWTQFSRMEQMMNQANQQSMQLMSLYMNPQ